MNASIKEQLRERLAEEMDRQRLTAYRLSQETGVSKSTIYEFLQGKPTMSIERIEEVFDHLGYEVRVDVVVSR